jgi:ABC-2 type transport system ATP-binding protein
MHILTVENISKNYGHIKALKGVSFNVPKGSVFGVLGPNGSGKTTLLGIIMDVLKASGGTFSFAGNGTQEEKRRRIGTLLETPNFYHYLNAVQNLKIAASIKQHGEEDIDRVLEVVNLSQRKFSGFSTYSLGMKQRLAIASALLGDPDILVLDEPTNGLDPVGIAEIRTLIKNLNKQGKTVIMASHLLDEVEKVCTHVAILKKGDLIATGHVDELFRQSDMVEMNAEDISRLVQVIELLPGVEEVKTDENGVTAFFEFGTANLAAINKHCFEHGVFLNKLIQKKKSLESSFIELTN